MNQPTLAMHCRRAQCPSCYAAGYAGLSNSSWAAPFKRLIVRAALISSTTIVALLLIVTTTTVDAQQPPNVRRVGVFPVGSSSGSDQFQALVKAFRDGLRDLGWIEGQNIVLEIRWGEGRIADFARISSELVGLSVDVIVTWGPQGVRAVQQTTGTLPIVMAVVHEPVAFGFVRSLARPGGNITGLALQDSELGTKRLELLKDIVPGMRRVALLWDPTGGGETGVRAIEAAAQKLGLTTQVLEVRRPEELGPAFARARKDGAHAMVQIASPLLATYRRRLIELAAAQHLPMTCETKLFV